jgi:adenine-specific DNA-methyltransferase
MSIELTCDNCNKSFKNKSSLKKHVCKIEELVIDDFSKISKTITEKISSVEKSSEGIFFTPSSIINKCINSVLEVSDITIKSILEPSCGSCEFITKLNSVFKNIKITGIEKNTKIYDEIKSIKFDKKNGNIIELIHHDFLTLVIDKKFDLIIGNPPFFVMKKQDVDSQYYDMFEGRPNIYIIFIIICLSKLNENGVLTFVLPLNFINCLYYNKLRDYIYSNYKIIDIVDCKDDTYIDTQQDTIYIVLQNNKINIESNNKKFTLKNGEYTIFNTEKNIKKLNELYKNTTNLFKLNFDVSVGTVVWNQVRDLLSDDPTLTRLIYSSDIQNNELIIKTYKNQDKKNYIDKDGLGEPVLVLNRGYGKGSYVLNYCLINMSEKYLIENHLISIKYTKPVSKELLIEKYNSIIKSFDNEKTKEFINIYFGNNAINTTELKYILPIYIA